jgi:CheY-like chemotaxis protein
MTENGHRHQPEYVEDLRREFLDEVGETLQSLDVALDAARHGRHDESQLVAACRRAAVQFRGPAAGFGLRGLSLVAARLEDYLTDAPLPLPPRAWDDLQVFIDLMTGEENLKTGAEIAGLVRTLPRKLGFSLGDIQVRNVEVLLIMPPGIQTRYVERELQQCGYRVAVVSDTVDAFGQVVDTMPDLIVVSALMPHLDGIDLAIALSAMPATRNIPLAVITALDDDDDRLHLLPRKVPVLHKGPSFGDDLYRALDSLFLI